MNAQSTRYDVVVVGGGLAGLTSAGYLAQAGLSVSLFEKSASLGGRAATQNYDDYRFNRGIHALYTGGAGEEVLKDLGIGYSGRSPKGGAFALRHGKLYPAPFDPASLFRTGLLSIADKFELMGLFMTLPKWKPSDLGRVSVKEWLEQNLHRPNTREVMAAIARTFVYSAALDIVSADVFAQKLQISAKHPVVYVDGGWQTLVSGLRSVAEKAGTQVVSGTRVESVIHEAGQVKGVSLRDGSIITADAVILAVTPQDALRLVDGGAYAPLRRLVDSLTPAQVACLDVALSQLPDRQHPIIQDIDRPLFMSTQSLWSKVAPEGGALIYAFKQLDPNRPTDPREDERELESLLDTVQPGWREAMVKRFFLPRIEAMGTLPVASTGGFEGRPKPEVPGIEGLYLAGDWVGADGFLSDASFASGRQVAYRILQSRVAVEHAVRANRPGLVVHP